MVLRSSRLIRSSQLVSETATVFATYDYRWTPGIIGSFRSWTRKFKMIELRHGAWFSFFGIYFVCAVSKLSPLLCPAQSGRTVRSQHGGAFPIYSASVTGGNSRDDISANSQRMKMRCHNPHYVTLVSTNTLRMSGIKWGGANAKAPLASTIVHWASTA